MGHGDFSMSAWTVLFVLVVALEIKGFEEEKISPLFEYSITPALHFSTTPFSPAHPTSTLKS